MLLLIERYSNLDLPAFYSGIVYQTLHLSNVAILYFLQNNTIWFERDLVASFWLVEWPTWAINLCNHGGGGGDGYSGGDSNSSVGSGFGYGDSHSSGDFGYGGGGIIVVVVVEVIVVVEVEIVMVMVVVSDGSGRRTEQK